MPTSPLLLFVAHSVGSSCPDTMLSISSRLEIVGAEMMFGGNETQSNELLKEKDPRSRSESKAAVLFS